MREAEVVRQDPELLEEIASGPEPVADLAPQLAGAVEHAVEGEREPVEHREQLGEAVGAVAEVGFEIVAVARQLPRFVSSGKHRNLRVEGGRGLGSKRPTPRRGSRSSAGIHAGASREGGSGCHARSSRSRALTRVSSCACRRRGLPCARGPWPRGGRRGPCSRGASGWRRSRP